jgi:hypothetical protein
MKNKKARNTGKLGLGWDIWIGVIGFIFILMIYLIATEPRISVIKVQDQTKMDLGATEEALKFLSGHREGDTIPLVKSIDKSRTSRLHREKWFLPRFDDEFPRNFEDGQIVMETADTCIQLFKGVLKSIPDN